MTRLLIICGIIFLSYQFAHAQIFFNANTDLTLSKGQIDSDYYYNGINDSKTDWRFGISKVTGLIGSQFGNNWTLMGQLALKRENDFKLNQFSVEQLNLRWDALNSYTSLSVGRIIHPFGSFYQKQLSPDLTFLDVPLSYGYYVNVSDRLGHMSNLGENGFAINGGTEWGQSVNYRYGYLNGLLFQHASADQKLQYDVSLGTNSFIGESIISDPLKWQLVTRIGWQPNWFTQLGLSTRYASFKQDDEINAPILDDVNFSQWQLALDYKIGISQFEISGEVKSSTFSVSTFTANEGFLLIGGDIDLSRFASFSFFNDLKYEPFSIPGSYLALRIESLSFNNMWDDNVWRCSLAAGYKLNRNTLIRLQYSTQTVAERSWDQDFFKTVITFHI